MQLKADFTRRSACLKMDGDVPSSAFGLRRGTWFRARRRFGDGGRALSGRVRRKKRVRRSLSASSDRHGCRSQRAAFTLVEVLVALVIFAMAAVVLGSTYLNILNSYEVVSRGVQINEDFAFARQLVLSEPDRTKLEQGGEFDTAGGRRARWNADIESSTIADVFRVTFTCEISDPARPEPDKVSQTFMLLRPTWSIDPAERSKLKEEAKSRILELQGKKQ